MSYIFMDESGDLGFDFSKQRTSKFFVVTLLYITDKRSIEKTVTKVYRSLGIKPRKGENSLHSFKESPAVRKRLLKMLSEKELRIFTICIDKAKIKLREEKGTLYNFICSILLDSIFEKEVVGTSTNNIEMIASRRETSRFLNDRFKEYLRLKIKSHYSLRVHVAVKSSYEEKCLQAADFISWAIFRKYEHEDATYYDLIKNKISVEHNLLT